MREGFDGAKFDQAEGAGGPGRIPEFVEADFAAVTIAGDVDLDVTESFVDEAAMIAGREAFEEGVGHFQIVEVPGGFIRSRGLRGCAHVTTGEEIGQGGMVLPKAEDGGEPGGAGKKRISVEVGSTPKQVISAPGAFGMAQGRFFPRAKSRLLAAGG